MGAGVVCAALQHHLATGLCMGLYQRDIEPSQILGNKMIYRLARLVALIDIGLERQGASQAEGLLSAVGPQWNHSNDTNGLRIDK